MIPFQGFTRPSLLSIQRRLLPLPSHPPFPPHTLPFDTPPPEAAVLIPLCNLDHRPHILLEVRAQQMRVHAGEVAFPGGKSDPEDASIASTALRETGEELSIPTANIEILGALEPQYSLGNRARVWPLVGFVHPSPPFPQPNTDNPLPSFQLSSLRLSASEVASIVPLPLEALAEPARRSVHNFRLDRRNPYWKIQVGDLVHCPREGRLEPGESGVASDLEIWGLSGWFLNELCEKVGWLEKPPRAREIE
ncbi:hypothetical protein P7C73_g2332, partial [Tremellales sp. Uapishka_1]